MHTNLRWTIGVIAAVSAFGISTSPAWSDDGHGERWRERREERREHWRDERARNERAREWRHVADRREFERRRELDRERAAAHWRFERSRGWRFEHRPGLWSPYFVWWMVDGRPFLRPFPTARIVRYPT